MSKRRNADKVRATDQTNAGVAGQITYSQVSGKSLVQIQAERMAELRFVDMMAAAGVDAGRMATEVLYFLPDGFIDAYTEVFTRALDGADGGAGAKGKANEKTAELGRAERKTSGGAGKKFKKYWTVADEDFFNLKDRIDKRLRGLAREMRLLIDEADMKGRAEGLSERDGQGIPSGRSIGIRCGSCGKAMGAGWKFCAGCGTAAEPEDSTDRSSIARR